jgi:hypothetical protein
MNSVEPTNKAPLQPTVSSADEQRDDMRNGEQIITPEVALPHLRVSCGYTITPSLLLCASAWDYPSQEAEKKT